MMGAKWPAYRWNWMVLGNQATTDENIKKIRISPNRLAFLCAADVGALAPVAVIARTDTATATPYAGGGAPARAAASPPRRGHGLRPPVVLDAARYLTQGAAEFCGDGARRVRQILRGPRIRVGRQSSNLPSSSPNSNACNSGASPRSWIARSRSLKRVWKISSQKKAYDTTAL